MANNWKTYKLGEVAEVKGGKRLPKGSILVKSKTNHPYIRVKDMGSRIISSDKLEYVPNGVFEKISRYIVNDKDIILSIVGTIGSLSLVDEKLDKASLTENCVKLTDFTNVDNCFLYYYLTSRIGQFEISKGIVGSTQPKLPIYNIKGLKVQLPPLLEQKSIANILSAIDDKIENNLAINKTLEEIAMALYKHWFVDFGPFQDGEFIDSELGPIPKGWEVKSIGDIYNTSSGGTPSRKKMNYYENGTISWIKSKELNNSFIVDTEEKITQEALLKSSTKLFPIKSVLIAMYGATVGEVAINSMESTCNQAICAIKEIELPYFYIFLYLKYEKEKILNQAVGSAQQNISQIIIKNLPLIKPLMSDVASVFVELENSYNILESNIKENQTLTELRDTLLPKLISGEVRLKEFREQIETII